MTVRRRARITGRRSCRPFLGLPKDMLNSPEFAALSPPAVKITLDIARLYNGQNNGAIQAPYLALQRERHWRSRTSLFRAIGEALRTGFLIRTRRGRRFGGTPEPSLYAISWEPIPASDLHSIVARAAPNTWKVQNAGPLNGLATVKTSPVYGLAEQKRGFGQRRNAGFASPPSALASPYSGPSLYKSTSHGEQSRKRASASKTWPAVGTPAYDALVAKYCYFDIPLHARAAA